MRQLDLSAIDAKYRASGGGTVAYDPRLMLGLLLYGYATGVTSSRKLERGIDENIAFRVIAAGPPGRAPAR